MTRSELLDLIDQVINKNGNRLIAGEKDNDVRKKLVNNVFVKESDTLENMLLSPSVTLAQKITALENQIQNLQQQISNIDTYSPVRIHGRTVVFDSNSAPIGTNISYPGSAIRFTINARNSNETLINVSYPSLGVSTVKKPVFYWVGSGGDNRWDHNNGLFITANNTDNWISGGQLVTQRVYDDPHGFISMFVIDVTR